MRRDDRDWPVLSPPQSRTVTAANAIEVCGRAAPCGQPYIEILHPDCNIPPVTTCADHDGRWSEHIPIGRGDNTPRVFPGGYDLDPRAKMLHLLVHKTAVMFEAASHPRATIPDGVGNRAVASVADSIVVPADRPPSDLEISVDITHTCLGDLVIELRSPAGNSITLSAITSEVMTTCARHTTRGRLRNWRNSRTRTKRGGGQ